jgi:hypothetical protein
MAVCADRVPPGFDVAAGHLSACWLHAKDLDATQAAPITRPAARNRGAEIQAAEIQAADSLAAKIPAADSPAADRPAADRPAVLNSSAPDPGEET